MINQDHILRDHGMNRAMSQDGSIGDRFSPKVASIFLLFVIQMKLLLDGAAGKLFQLRCVTT